MTYFAIPPPSLYMQGDVEEARGAGLVAMSFPSKCAAGTSVLASRRSVPHCLLRYRCPQKGSSLHFFCVQSLERTVQPRRSTRMLLRRSVGARDNNCQGRRIQAPRRS